MLQYDFMNQKEIKKRDISDAIKKHYKIEINADSIFNEDFENTNLDKILKTELPCSILSLKGLYRKWTQEDGETKEAKSLKDIVPKIMKKVFDWRSYWSDLLCDIYMGLLLADEKHDVPFNDFEDAWCAEACNKKINVQNARRNYPYSDYDFMSSHKIPGGCREYHSLMTRQENMGIFDTSEGIKSLQRYAFRKTYTLYQELRKLSGQTEFYMDCTEEYRLIKGCTDGKCSAGRCYCRKGVFSISHIENLLLFEKSFGIGYTGQVFLYVRNVKERAQLDRLQGFIQQGLQINPMFFRKNVVDNLWSYLQRFGYNDASLKYAEEVLSVFATIINKAYVAMLEFEYCAYYLAYHKLEEQGYLSDVQDYLSKYWDETYFREDMLRKIFNAMGDLADWYGVETVDDCFYCYEGCDAVTKINILVNSLLEDWNATLRERGIVSQKVGQFKWLHTAKPKEGLGRKIYQEARECFDKMEEYPENREELHELFYQIKDDIFKKRKQEVWKDKDPKSSAKRLEPFHVYAIIHAGIMRVLNG